jgi:hypothetical protein
VRTSLVNAFIGRTTPPSDADLERALGGSKPVWDRLIAEMASEHDAALREWKSYSIKAGWSLRLKRGPRTVAWLVPCEGCFQVALILGDKALLAARQSRLPARVLAMLDEAPRHPEGTGIRLPVTGAKDLPVVKKLATLKLKS